MRTLLLQDWYEKNDLINASFFALAEIFADADIGFLKNFENTLPQELQRRKVAFYGARATRKSLDDFETLVSLEAKIPWQEYDLVLLNTRGYLKHLRTTKEGPRVVAYQHDLLPPLWHTNIDDLDQSAAANLLRHQELDLEFASSVNLTIAANTALATRLKALFQKNVPMAYPLVDSDFFTPDIDATNEYFAVMPTEDIERTLALAACLVDKFVVMGETLAPKLFRELKPANIFYTGDLNLEDVAYYLAGAKALICGESRRVNHLPLAALKMGIPIIAHPTQGLGEILADGDAGFELITGGSDELLSKIRYYANRRHDHAGAMRTVEWLNKASFSRRIQKAILHES